MTEKLSQPQQEALLELLVYTAKAHGNVDARERGLLERYARAVGVSVDALPAGRPMEEVLSVFDTPGSRVQVLQHLLRLSYIDGKFDDRERSAIIDLSAMMGVPMTLLEKIEEWVLAGMRWAEAGEQLAQEAARVVRL